MDPKICNILLSLNSSRSFTFVLVFQIFQYSQSSEINQLLSFGLKQKHTLFFNLSKMMEVKICYKKFVLLQVKKVFFCIVNSLRSNLFD